MWKLLIILLFSLNVQALTEDELVDTISNLCDFNNPNITEEDKEDCYLEYVNCSIGHSGKYESDDIIRCINKRD